MIEICEKKKCTGCSACMNACNNNAITMQEDSCGFIYPQIDKTKCVDCGLCAKICPANSSLVLNYPQKCYAAVLEDKNDLKNSSSGGAATAFARNIIKQGGVVYGCCGDDITVVSHIRIDNINDVDRLRGSKYVQSNINFVLRSVLDDLKNDRRVLFIGTPCQIAGLKSFLHKDYENLIAVDLVCHGVPSQKMLNDNIASYTSNTKNIQLSFRKKINSKIEYGWYLNDNNGVNIEKQWYNDSYMLGFISCLTFRYNCCFCRYANSSRISDITLSDFWCIGSDSRMKIGDGVSSCLVNTEKGNLFFDTLKTELKFVERDVVESINGNGQLQRPSSMSPNYFLFQELYPKIGFEMAVKKSLRGYKIKMFMKQYFYQFKNTILNLIR